MPRSFGLGYHITAGSLVYANYWGHSGETPNAYLTPGDRGFAICRASNCSRSGSAARRCTLVPAETDAAMGVPVAEYKPTAAASIISGSNTTTARKPRPTRF